MNTKHRIAGWKDKVLFTPGPLTTSQTVKQAMLRDVGSRDTEFIDMVRAIRRKLVALGNGRPDDYTAIPMQGCGTFGLESVVGSTVPPDGKLMIIINGAYGKRLAKIASVLGIETLIMQYPEKSIPDIDEIEKKLKSESGITNVSVVHCETTTGILNPIKEIGNVVKRSGAMYFVDAMSSFGAVPLNLDECHIDYLVSSANKCIEGVPGFSFIIAKLDSLKQTEGYARSMSLDLLDQYNGFEKNGQFRFTPPTHALLAFHQALCELENEGGVSERAQRYRNNYETLLTGMRKMGFREYLKPEDQCYIITSFLYPDDPKFKFEDFCNRLSEKDCVIYPGKVSDAECFRIGNIGRLFESDVNSLLLTIEKTIEQMEINLK